MRRGLIDKRGGDLKREARKPFQTVWTELGRDS